MLILCTDLARLACLECKVLQKVCNASEAVQLIGSAHVSIHVAGYHWCSVPLHDDKPEQQV